MAFFPNRSAYMAIRGNLENRPVSWPRDVDPSLPTNADFEVESDRRSAPRN